MLLTCSKFVMWLSMPYIYISKFKIKKMKKLIIALLIFVGSFSVANAQTTTKTVHKKATTTTAKAGTKNVKEKKTTTTHVKKDGTADKRFKENKTTTTHLKKDGTADKRFKANKK